MSAPAAAPPQSQSGGTISLAIDGLKFDVNWGGAQAPTQDDVAQIANTIRRQQGLAMPTNNPKDTGNWRRGYNFAVAQGFTPAGVGFDPTGKRHNPGSGHYTGNDQDVDVAGKSDDDVRGFMKSARAAGFLVRDERTRPPGRAVWKGPHIHIGYYPGGAPEGTAAAPVQTPEQEFEALKAYESRPDVQKQMKADAGDTNAFLQRQAQEDKPQAATKIYFGPKGVSKFTLPDYVQAFRLGQEHVALRNQQSGKVTGLFPMGQAAQLIREKLGEHALDNLGQADSDEQAAYDYSNQGQLPSPQQRTQAYEAASRERRTGTVEDITNRRRGRDVGTQLALGAPQQLFSAATDLAGKYVLQLPIDVPPPQSFLSGRPLVPGYKPDASRLAVREGLQTSKYFTPGVGGYAFGADIAATAGESAEQGNLQPAAEFGGQIMRSLDPRTPMGAVNFVLTVATAGHAAVKGVKGFTDAALEGSLIKNGLTREEASYTLDTARQGLIQMGYDGGGKVAGMLHQLQVELGAGQLGTVAKRIAPQIASSLRQSYQQSFDIPPIGQKARLPRVNTGADLENMGAPSQDEMLRTLRSRAGLDPEQHGVVAPAPQPTQPQPSTAPQETGLPQSGALRYFAPEDIQVHPSIQYKSGITDQKAKVTPLLKGTNVYDVDQGGTLTLWENKDGDVYAVNGHHRLELAQRADRFISSTQVAGTMKDVDRVLPGRVLREQDGWTLDMARAQGALENIRDQKGTALDAAKVIRSLGKTPEDLPQMGVSLKGNMGRNIDGLLGLSDEGFNAVDHGSVPEDVAAGVGAARLDPAREQAALRAASDLRSYDEGLTLARKVGKREPVSSPGDEFGLFADDESAKTYLSTVAEETRIQSEVKRQVARQFGELLKVPPSLLENEHIDAGARVKLAAEYGESKTNAKDRVDFVFDHDKELQAQLTGVAQEVMNGKVTREEAAGRILPTVKDKLSGNLERYLQSDRGASGAGTELARQSTTGSGERVPEAGGIAAAISEIRDRLKSNNKDVPFADVAKKHGVNLEQLKSHFAWDGWKGTWERKIPAKDIAPPLSGQPYYHGHRETIGKFEPVDAGDYSTNLFGQGVYFTDSPSVANRYAKVGTTRVALPDDLKLASADEPTPPSIARAWEKQLSHLGYEHGDLSGTEKMKLGDAWKQIESDHSTTGIELAELKADLTQGVINAGYDGLTHRANDRGGWRSDGNAATNNVTILYNTDRVKPYSALDEKAREADVTDGAAVASHYLNNERGGESEAVHHLETQFGLDKGTAQEAVTRAVKQPASESAELNMQVIPGAKQFIEQDVVPTAGKVITLSRGMAAEIRDTFSPASASESAGLAARIVREKAAELMLKKERATVALAAVRKAFNRMTEAERFDFIHRMETGQTQKTMAGNAYAKLMRDMLDERRQTIQNLGNGKLDHFIQDYFPHIWEDPNKAASVFGQILGKRPLEGPKSFLKKRTIPTIQDGIKAGLKPVSTNPVDLVLLKLHEMDRYIMGQTTLTAFKDAGIAEYHYASQRGPKDWKRIDDRVGTVYGDPNIEIKEAYDLGVRKSLQDVIDNLPGLSYTRTTKTGNRGWGYAQGANKMVTKFGGENGIIMHELGHILDARYGLWQQITAVPGNHQMAIDLRKQIRQELRDLADMRFEGLNPTVAYRNYVRQKPEQMANAVHALIYAPDRMQDVAPTVKKRLEEFLASKPELKPVLDVKPSLVIGQGKATVSAGGLVIRGSYWAPKEAANVLNNYLSPGFRGRRAWFDTAMALNNSMNMAELGLSGFHLLGTAINASASKLAIGLEDVMAGRAGRGAKNLLAGAIPLYAQIDTMVNGTRLMKAALSSNPPSSMLAMVDALQAGGGRIRGDTYYTNSAAGNFVKALQEGNWIGAGLRLPAAVFHGINYAIFREVVPRLKLGAFADMARYELDRLGPSATHDEVRRAMARAWDSIDNRFGMVVYDNLFWQRMLKDGMMLSTRAVGWNVGTIRELGMAPLDVLNTRARMQAGDSAISHRTAYVVGLVMTHAIGAAIYQYLMTGQLPSEFKDFVFPKNGQKNDDGTDARTSLPDYVKDMAAYATHPVKTVINKMSPLVASIGQMFRNEDFYGKEILNEDDPLVQKVGEFAKYVGEQYIPFTARNEMQTEATAGKFDVAPLIGINPAPKEFSRSAALNKAQAIERLRMGDQPKTAEQADIQQAKSYYLSLVANGKQIEADKYLALQPFEANQRDGLKAKWDKEAESPRLLYLANGMGLHDVLRVYGLATKAEREQRDRGGKSLSDMIIDKFERGFASGSVTAHDLEEVADKYPEFRAEIEKTIKPSRGASKPADSSVSVS